MAVDLDEGEDGALGLMNTEAAHLHFPDVVVVL